MGVSGSCHCGQVRVEATRAPDEVTHCNCSICKRLGALWAYYHPDEVRIEGQTSAISGATARSSSTTVRHAA